MSKKPKDIDRIKQFIEDFKIGLRTPLTQLALILVAFGFTTAEIIKMIGERYNSDATYKSTLDHNLIFQIVAKPIFIGLYFAIFLADIAYSRHIKKKHGDDIPAHYLKTTFIISIIPLIIALYFYAL